MTTDEVLQQLLDTNHKLVTMMTADDDTDVEINGQTYPSLRKYAKSILMGDMQSLVDEVTVAKSSIDIAKTAIDTIYTNILAIKENIDSIKTSIDTAKSSIDASKQQIDTINSNVNAKYNTILQLEQDLETLKTDIQNYKTQITQKLNEITQAQTRIAQSEVRARRFALEAQASKLQAGEYANKAPNELVNCWAVESGDVVVNHSSTCEYSSRHWYEMIRQSAKTFIQTCYEYVPFEKEGGAMDTICVVGSPTGGDEHIELTLSDGTKSKVSIRGNYLTCNN